MRNYSGDIILGILGAVIIFSIMTDYTVAADKDSLTTVKHAGAIEIGRSKYEHLVELGLTESEYFVVVDFTLPSTSTRLFLVDTVTKDITSFYVAQGVPGFSNTVDSHQSSLGLYKTAETYTGKYGYSLRLDGLEPGINDNIRMRDIVMHPSKYVGDGNAGTSWGCLSIDDDVSTQLIDIIKDGTIIYVHGE